MAAGLLGGCSGIPTLVPDRLPHHGWRTPQLVGAQGPLGPARSRAVLARLAASGPETEIFERHLAREEAVADSPLSTGNAVTLLQDGPATYNAMLAAINAAQDHIHLETYILDDDEVGRLFVRALVARRQAGVQVALMHDSAGTVGTPDALFAQLRSAGVQVLAFNPLNPLDPARSGRAWALNQRDHRKLLVVDGRIAFLGGINISSVYSGGSSQKPVPGGALGWRDTDLALQGPVVADLQRLFLASWASQQGPPLAPALWFPPLPAAGPLVVRAIASTPDEPFSAIYATLLSAIDAAQSSVMITNAYFAPDVQLLQALEQAAARGAAVSLILPGQTDSWLVLQAGHGHYERLLRAGVTIHERQGAILHAKVALVDGVWATVGSTNLDWRSVLHNQELNAVVLGTEFGQQVQAMFRRDLAASTPITLATWQQRGWLARLQEWFAALWVWWL